MMPRVISRSIFTGFGLSIPIRNRTGWGYLRHAHVIVQRSAITLWPYLMSIGQTSAARSEITEHNSRFDNLVLVKRYRTSKNDGNGPPFPSAPLQPNSIKEVSGRES